VQFTHTNKPHEYCEYKCKKTKFIKIGYRQRSCTSKTAKMHHFVRLKCTVSSLQCQ